MLHPALYKLLSLRMRGMRRRMLRGIKTPKGALFFAMGVLMFATWLGPSVIFAFRDQAANPNQLEATMPLIIIGMCLLTLISSAGERAIYFSPGEVEFLFPGPFGRRELLGYKVLGLLIGVSFSSVIFSVILLRFASSWIAAFAGVFLSLTFVQLFSMALLLIGQMMAERAYTRIRMAVLLAFGVVLAAALGPAIAMRGMGRFGDTIVKSQESPMLQYAFLPLKPFAKAAAAEHIFPDLILWSAIAVAVNGALVAFILWLDAEYRETAIGVSQKMYARIQRAQRSGMAPMASSSKGRVPQLPWWGGAGPIAWRQATNALRNARSMMMILLLVALAIGIPTVARGESSAKIWPMTLAMAIWLTVFLSMMIRFDFRSDIEQMDWLKMMPLKSWALVAGQLAVPVLICSALQVALVAVTVQIAGRPELLLMTIAFAPPFNILLFGVENTLFLLAPTKVVAFSPGDFQVFGRQLLFLLIKMVFVTIAALVAVGGGWLVYWLSGHMMIPAIVFAWVLVAAQALAMIPAAAWAYRRFDVSLDTPA
jgi:hypothetical protein